MIVGQYSSAMMTGTSRAVFSGSWTCFVCSEKNEAQLMRGGCSFVQSSRSPRGGEEVRGDLTKLTRRRPHDMGLCWRSRLVWRFRVLAGTKDKKASRVAVITLVWRYQFPKRLYRILY